MFKTRNKDWPSGADVVLQSNTISFL